MNLLPALKRRPMPSVHGVPFDILWKVHCSRAYHLVCYIRLIAIFQSFPGTQCVNNGIRWIFYAQEKNPITRPAPAWSTIAEAGEVWLTGSIRAVKGALLMDNPKSSLWSLLMHFQTLHHNPFIPHCLVSLRGWSRRIRMNTFFASNVFIFRAAPFAVGVSVCFMRSTGSARPRREIRRFLSNE